MSDMLDKDLKESKKDNSDAGLFTHYLSDDVFIINPDITRTIFNPVNGNKTCTESWSESDKKLGKVGKNKKFGKLGRDKIVDEDLIKVGKADVLIKYNEFDFEVSSNYLDKQGNYLHLNMNECFLLFGFIIKKFEDVNKNNEYKDFEFDIETSWNEIVKTLNINGGSRNLYKFEKAFELLRKTKLKIGRKTSGLISEYENTWPEITDPENPDAVRLNKKETIIITLPKNIVKFVKNHNRKILVSYETFSKIKCQITKKLYVYLLGLSTLIRNMGIGYETLEEVLGYNYSYDVNSKKFDRKMPEEKVRKAIKKATKELVELGFLIDSNCLYKDVVGVTKYKFYDKVNEDYNKDKNSTIESKDFKIKKTKIKKDDTDLNCNLDDPKIAKLLDDEGF
ncbi:hypothetical protein [Colwellia sp. MB3u-4]|uniref:hypothetical protein n=1 Tax=Colwellia sp. MB3u-4 TaxID=2759822 RepID=UPI0015F54A77|nr:hypothetical protein [Colwellia sp. MB3u-4]MBA6287833.1 hypothetical protein [Colwellia sp. MB3u-4]